MEVLSLGTQPPSNALLSTPTEKERYYPLRLVVCRQCNLLQLDYDVPHDELFTNQYPYFSGQSKQWVEHCAAYAAMIYKRLGLGKDSVVFEIGGNDGTLLKNFLRTHTEGGGGGKASRSEQPVFFVANYEASPNVADASRANGVPVVYKAWGRGVQQVAYPADLIIANNVLAHDPDIQGFVAATARYLNTGGTFTAEFPWALNLIEQTQFDTIYHEHYSYLTLHALVPLFIEYGLRIYDVEKLPTHGGSLRIYASHTGDHEVSKNVIDTMAEETKLSKMETYWAFRDRAYKIRSSVETFLASKPNALIAGYGAAAKGNTLINWLGLTKDDIVAVGDTTPAKVGKWLPGSRIPIVTEHTMLAYKPEYVWILPWNWTDEIVSRLQSIRGWGGQFVTAIPELKVF